MPDITDESIVSQIKDWAHDLADQIPPWALDDGPSMDPLRHPPSNGRQRSSYAVAVAAAVILVLVAGFAVWRSGRTSEADLSAGGGATISVIYERVEYSQSATLSCSAGSLPSDGFDEATFETWGDLSGMRWRNRVTYPDGPGRDLIVIGIPWYPTDLYVRGELLGAAPGCNGPVGALVAEPGQNTFFSLNPLTDVPTVEDPAGPTHGSERSRPAVSGYRDSGVQVPGDHTDSQGRNVDLWRQTRTGSVGDDTTQLPVVQTTEWLVDPTSGEILEKTYTNAVEGLGSATSKLTLVTSETTIVDANFFDTDSYQQVQ